MLPFKLENITPQIRLDKNFLYSSYIILLDVNFENLIIELHVLIISSILAEFQKKLNINSYATSDLFKFQIFIVKNYV